MARRMISAEVLGKKQLEAALKFKGKVAVSGISKDMMMAALLVHGSAVKLIQKGPKTGREYHRGAITHVASAPGQAPATDTGNLVSNIIPDVREKAGEIEVVVVSRAPYSAALEFGTRHIAPRPFMHPAYEMNKERILKMVAKSLKKGTNA